MRSQAAAIQIGFVIGIVACWHFASASGLVRPSVLPSPQEVAASLRQLAGDQDFIMNTLVTLRRIALTFCIAVPAGVVAGCIIAEMDWLRSRISTPLGLAMAVPKSIFLPVFLLAFGVGDVQKIAFATSYVVFALCLGTISAIESIPPGFVSAARSFGATRFQIATRIYAPYVMPSFIANLRMAVIFTVAGVLVAEMYASQYGLGMLMMRWSDSFLVGKMIAAVLLVSVVTIIVNEAMRAVEYRFGRWRRAPDAS